MFPFCVSLEGVRVARDTWEGSRLASDVPSLERCVPEKSHSLNFGQDLSCSSLGRVLLRTRICRKGHVSRVQRRWIRSMPAVLDARSRIRQAPCATKSGAKHMQINAAVVRLRLFTAVSLRQSPSIRPADPATLQSPADSNLFTSSA